MPDPIRPEIVALLQLSEQTQQLLRMVAAEHAATISVVRDLATEPKPALPLPRAASAEASIIHALETGVVVTARRFARTFRESSDINAITEARREFFAAIDRLNTRLSGPAPVRPRANLGPNGADHR